MAFCIHCGAESKQDVKFCPKCGKEVAAELRAPVRPARPQPVSVGPVPADVQEQPGKRSPWFMLGLLGLLVVALAVVALFFTRSDDEPAVARPVPTTEAGEDAETTVAPEIVETRAIGSALPTAAQGTSDLAVGLLAPVLIGPDSDGAEVTVGQDGQPRVLVLMAHWCSHCQATLPKLVSVADRRGDIDGVEVVVVVSATSSGQPNYPPEDWVEREDWRGRAVFDDEESSLGIALGLESFPTWIAIDEDGRVVDRVSGEMDDASVVAFAAKARGSAGDSDSTETTAAASGDTVELVIESWRNDDLAIWQDTIIPAFEAANPGIEVTFSPTAPAEYSGVLQARLEGGTAGDLITCRPFDASLRLYDAGFLASLNDLDGMANFGDVAKSAWITDDGSDVFCVPMASVIHGFIYNKAIFDELGLSEPTTEAELYALLDAVKADGTYDAFAMGSADQWEAATMGFQNIGPNYWAGEDGRRGLIVGSEALSDPQYVDTLTTLATWANYMPSGFEAITYPDSQYLFTLGQAAVYPSGSWEIGLFNEQANFKMGAFPPPVKNAGDTCYISDHTDIALGMNAGTANPNEAMVFLDWVASPEFSSLYANAMPGFFSMANEPVALDDALAQEFVSWRGECESTIRNSYQILSRGEPNLERELWAVSASVVNGTLAPADAAQRLQDGLASWYEPQAGN